MAADRDRLAAGAAELGVALSQAQLDTLIAYRDEFAKWNRAYNLSAVREPGEMIGRHLLDSLAVAPHLRGERLIDVGTGGGLPGLVLAVVYPERHFTLLDSNGKKTRFVFHAATQLGLNNIAVENTRVESLTRTGAYDAVISRAFASLSDMVSGCRHLLADDGVFLAMKGQYPEAELRELGASASLESSHRLAVPGESGERHLLVLRPH